MKEIIGKIVDEKMISNLCSLYDIKPETIIPLKQKNRCVFEIVSNDRKYILKLFDADERDKNEIQGEIDFAHACLDEGISTYNPLHSVNGNTVEEIAFRKGRTLYAFLYEKIEGFEVEEDNDAFREFTPVMLQNWGKLTGKLHRVSRKFTTEGRKFNRNIWNKANDGNFKKYIPATDIVIHRLFEKRIREINAIPRTDDNFGLIHGDLHYGNFFITDTGLSVIDFDSSSYYYYAADIAISLYSLLPYPRYRREEREKFAQVFFNNYLNGYLSEYDLPKENLKYIPLFIEYEDLVNYIALYRNWDMDNLSKAQKRIFMRNRYHLVNAIPFVDMPTPLNII